MASATTTTITKVAARLASATTTKGTIKAGEAKIFQDWGDTRSAGTSCLLNLDFTYRKKYTTSINFSIKTNNQIAQLLGYI